jgi:hypothetical protein
VRLLKTNSIQNGLVLCVAKQMMATHLLAYFGVQA